MNAVLLDTDVFSFLLRDGDTRAELYRPLVQGKTISLSFVTVGELYAWSFTRDWGQRRVSTLEEKLRSAVVVPFDLELCRVYGRVKASLAPGKVVAANDLWIAVSAIRHSIPLLTHNRRHFADIPRLSLAQS